jgi:hypothetical protein
MKRETPFRPITEPELFAEWGNQNPIVCAGMTPVQMNSNHKAKGKSYHDHLRN